MAATDFTSLGAHRLPVRWYGAFEHITPDQYVVESAILDENQSAGHGRNVTVAEVASAQDLSFASIVGEAAYPPRTDLGAHRLPRRLYESFPHGVTNTGAVAENATAISIEIARGVQGVTVAESVFLLEIQTVASSLPDTVAEVAAYADEVDVAFTRVGALVSTVGAMGVPRQRWVDFIHPAAVDEVTNLIDVQDAAILGEIVGFIGDFLTLTDTQNAGAIYHEAVIDALALFEDVVTTGSIYVEAMSEVAGSLADSAGADIQAIDVAVHEVNTLVDIQLISATSLNGFILDVLDLRDIPGVAGELYESVNEVLSALAFADIPGAFVPGVNVDGARTVHVPAEMRVLEVELDVEMV